MIIVKIYRRLNHQLQESECTSIIIELSSLFNYLFIERIIVILFFFSFKLEKLRGDKTILGEHN